MTPPRHPSYLFGLNRPHTGSEGAILRAPAGRVRARSGAGHRALGVPNRRTHSGAVSVGFAGVGRWRSRSLWTNVADCTNAHEQAWACVRRRRRAWVRVRTRVCVCGCVCVCICFVFHGLKCVKRIRKQSNKLSRTHNEPNKNQTIAYSITATASNETTPHGQHRSHAKTAQKHGLKRCGYIVGTLQKLLRALGKAQKNEVGFLVTSVF
jgi:hypothetical protein